MTYLVLRGFVAEQYGAKGPPPPDRDWPYRKLRRMEDPDLAQLPARARLLEPLLMRYCDAIGRIPVKENAVRDVARACGLVFESDAERRWFARGLADLVASGRILVEEIGQQPATNRPPTDQVQDSNRTATGQVLDSNTTQPAESIGPENHQVGRKEGRKRVPRAKPPVDPEASAIGLYLLEAIRSHTPTTRATEQDADGWALEIERAMRIDHRSPEDLRGMIDWAHRSAEGDFWRANIRSGEKLREKFEVMQAQRKRGNGAPKNGHVTLPPPPIGKNIPPPPADPIDVEQAKKAIEEMKRKVAYRPNGKGEP